MTQPQPESGVAAKEVAPDAPSLASRVNALVHAISSAPAGDVAALRRAGSAPTPAFWKIGAMLELDDRDEARWALIASGIAQTQGQHTPGMSFGRALNDAGVSEPRVLRLLQAHDRALADAVRVTLHQLASRGARFDWVGLARLILSDGRPDAEMARRSIARDYFRSAGSDSSTSKEG